MMPSLDEIDKWVSVSGVCIKGRKVEAKSLPGSADVGVVCSDVMVLECMRERERERERERRRNNNSGSHYYY